MKINVSNYIVSTCKKWSEYNFISDMYSNEIYTYRQYFDKIESSINYLHDSGLDTNDFVVIEIDNSIASLALFMGMLVNHIIPILVSPNIKANEMEKICANSNPKAWFYSTKNKKVHKNKENLKFFPIIDVENAKNCYQTKYKNNLSNIAYIVYTSGTTGSPKRVEISHENMLSEIESMAVSYNMTSKDRNMCILPLYHASSLYRSILITFHTGGWVKLYKEFSYENFWLNINRDKITFVQIVPSIMKILLANKDYFSEGHQKSLRFVGSASAFHPIELIMDFEKSFDVYLLQSYGMTEATCCITLNPLNKKHRRMGSVGKPISVNSIKILDKNNNSLPVNKIGKIVITGRNITNHDINDKNNSKDLDTGDTGYLDDKGFLWLVGRDEDIIKRAGYRISPYEIESAILNIHPNFDAAVLGVEHDLLGQDIIAFVDKKLSGICERDLIKELKFNLASYKMPSEIIFLDKIPLIGVGKVDKVRLKEFYKSMFS